MRRGNDDDALLKAPAVLLHGETESTRSTVKLPQTIQNMPILKKQTKQKKTACYFELHRHKTSTRYMYKLKHSCLERSPFVAATDDDDGSKGLLGFFS